MNIKNFSFALVAAFIAGGFFSSQSIHGSNPNKQLYSMILSGTRYKNVVTYELEEGGKTLRIKRGFVKPGENGEEPYEVIPDITRTETGRVDEASYFPTFYGSSAQKQFKKVETIIIPSFIREIGDYSFCRRLFPNLKEFYIEFNEGQDSCLEKIGAWAFFASPIEIFGEISKTSGKKSRFFNHSGNLEKIGDSAFKSSHIKEISLGAFCKDMPKSRKKTKLTVEKGAFWKCRDFEVFDCENKKEVIIGESAFEQNIILMIFNVILDPNGTIQLGKNSFANTPSLSHFLYNIQNNQINYPQGGKQQVFSCNIIQHGPGDAPLSKQ